MLKSLVLLAALTATASADDLGLDTHILRFSDAKMDTKTCVARAKSALDTLFKKVTVGSDTVTANAQNETFQIQCLQGIANIAYFAVTSVNIGADAIQAHIKAADKLMQK